ncbi:hypothetical protein BJ741DRAFT_50285 [Chytriomyces cf. hyalinus JEL632]|nr:hypothetical protein BJ741DRAFT_50285 [Chytriomyces cf. hyalinus JEL632]
MDHLPAELVESVLLYITAEDLKRVRLVNTPTVWQEVAARLLFHTIAPSTIGRFLSLIEERPDWFSFQKNGLRDKSNSLMHPHPLACIVQLDLSQLVGFKAGITDLVVLRLAQQMQFRSGGSVVYPQPNELTLSSNLPHALLGSVPLTSSILHAIDFRDCFAVTDVSLKALLQTNPGLRRIGLAGCSSLTHRALDAVLLFSPNLEVLDVSLCALEPEAVTRFAVAAAKSLKELRILVLGSLPAVRTGRVRNLLMDAGMSVKERILTQQRHVDSRTVPRQLGVGVGVQVLVVFNEICNIYQMERDEHEGTSGPP